MCGLGGGVNDTSLEAFIIDWRPITGRDAIGKYIFLSTI